MKWKLAIIVNAIICILLLRTCGFVWQETLEDPAMTVLEKPVIYLYPEDTTEVSVKLGIDGGLTCTYPAYDASDGWRVTADPDGRLTDANGMEYHYLYWEGASDIAFDFSEGHCIPGDETAAFLETALAQMGLNRKEANEFIVYWLPRMQENPYNIISFQQETYTDVVGLQIDPLPDTLIRVYMAYRPSQTAVTLPVQEFGAPERRGFTVVEWGGSEVIE